MKDFKGKIAVITGAASGIGRALAEKCTQEGIRIVLADIEEQVSVQGTRRLIFDSNSSHTRTILQ